MPKLFISYRRDDARHIAARICDQLELHFSSDSIFFDVDSIKPGLDFRTHIKKCIQESHVVIAVIGPAWSSIKFADGTKAGTRRLDDPGDYLRIELETALSDEVLIVPLLVDGAAMPSKESLPPSLSELSFRHAARVGDGRDFRPSMERFIHDLESLLKDEDERKKRTSDDAKRKAERDRQIEELAELESWAEQEKSARVKAERRVAELEAERQRLETARLAAETERQERAAIAASQAATHKAAEEEAANVKPTVKIVALVNGKEVVGAKVRYNESTWDTPVVLGLPRGQSYHFQIAYSDPAGNEFTAELDVNPTWNGERIENVILLPWKPPGFAGESRREHDSSGEFKVLGENVNIAGLETSYDPETGIASAKGDVHIHYGGVEIHAERAEYNSLTKDVSAFENVIVIKDGRMFCGERATYNFETRHLDASDLQAINEESLTAELEALRKKNVEADAASKQAEVWASQQILSVNEHFLKGHWEIASMEFEKLLAQKHSLAEYGPKLVICLLNAHEELLERDAVRIKDILRKMNEAGLTPLAEPLRLQFNAKVAAATQEKPRWKFWK